MCHGEFPDDFLTDEKHRELYQKCLLAMDLLSDTVYYRRSHFDDEFTRMGRQIAYYLSSGLRPDHMGLSYLSLKPPGIRQAIYRAASGGAHKIICVGASGLMVPGHGASLHVPAALRNVIRDNPALDVVLAPSGISTGDTARLIKRSIEYVFNGAGDVGAEPKGLEDGGGEDMGVVLICSHDYDAARCGSAIGEDKFIDIASRLSDLSKRSYIEGGKSYSVSFMHGVAHSLKEMGAPAVETGFVDFALPGIEDAARSLIKAGATSIIAVGMPILLHRHPFSLRGPSMAIERLKRALPDTDIVYVKPDPEPIAESVARMLMGKVIEAELSGASLRESLRER